ncbi:MAG: hypothetical protein WCF04_06975 [Candidatus Nanopelagicales bacterium]
MLALLQAGYERVAPVGPADPLPTAVFAGDNRAAIGVLEETRGSVHQFGPRSSPGPDAVLVGDDRASVPR